MQKFFFCFVPNENVLNVRSPDGGRRGGNVGGGKFHLCWRNEFYDDNTQSHSQNGHMCLCVCECMYAVNK